MLVARQREGRAKLNYPMYQPDFRVCTQAYFKLYYYTTSAKRNARRVLAETLSS